VDGDGSAIAKAIVAGVQADRNLNATVSVEADARAAVRRGNATVAVIIPKGSATPPARRSSAGETNPASSCSTTPRAASSSRWCAGS